MRNNKNGNKSQLKKMNLKMNNSNRLIIKTKKSLWMMIQTKTLMTKEMKTSTGIFIVKNLNNRKSNQEWLIRSIRNRLKSQKKFKNIKNVKQEIKTWTSLNSKMIFRTITGTLMVIHKIFLIGMIKYMMTIVRLKEIKKIMIVPEMFKEWMIRRVHKIIKVISAMIGITNLIKTEKTTEIIEMIKDLIPIKSSSMRSLKNLRAKQKVNPQEGHH